MLCYFCMFHVYDLATVNLGRHWDFLTELVNSILLCEIFSKWKEMAKTLDFMFIKTRKKCLTTRITIITNGLASCLVRKQALDYVISQVILQNSSIAKKHHNF